MKITAVKGRKIQNVMRHWDKEKDTKKKNMKIEIDQITETDEE